MVKLVPPGHALSGVFRPPSEPPGLGLLQGGWYVDLLFVAVDAFQHRLLGFQGLQFNFGFERGRSFSLYFWCHLGENGTDNS